MKTLLRNNGLSMVLSGLFLIFWPCQAVELITGPHFWFQSFQNWQSEFLAVLSIVTLSIFLRQHGSPESKTVDAPHSQTGR